MYNNNNIAQYNIIYIFFFKVKDRTSYYRDTKPMKKKLYQFFNC